METRRLVFELFPRGVNNIVWDYFTSKSKKPFQKGLYGEYEACSYIFDREHGQKALYGACAGGWIEIIKCMILNDVIDYEDLAFKKAFKYNQIEVVKLLLKHNEFFKIDNFLQGLVEKVEIVHLFPKGHIYLQHLLLTALIQKNEEAIEFVLEEYSNAEYIMDLHMPSCQAVACGEIEKIKEMISNNSFQSLYCIGIACSIGNCEVIKVLLELDLFEYQGLICKAIKDDKIDVINLLLPRCKFDNGEIIRRALKCGNIKLAKFIIKNKPKYANSLYHVYRFGNTKLVKLALKNNPEWRFCACIGTHDNVEATQLLFEYLHSVDKLNQIAFLGSALTCCSRGNFNVLHYLINSAGIGILNEILDINDEIYDICFIKACRNGHVECARLMIQHGVTIISHGMHFARLNGHFELSEELKKLCLLK